MHKKTVSQTSAGLFFILAAVFFMNLAFAAEAEDAGSVLKSNYDAWGVRCMKSNEDNCEIFQRLTMAKTGARIAELAIGFPEGETQNARGVLVLPLGVKLTSPVSYSVDEGESNPLTIQTCVNKGCIAEFPLDPAALEELLMGGNLNITFTSIKGQTGNIVMSLKGITQAIDSITG